MFQKEAIFCYFLRSNLDCLGIYLTHLDVADMSNLFYFHFMLHDQERWRAYRDPIHPAWRDSYTNAYVPI